MCNHTLARVSPVFILGGALLISALSGSVQADGPGPYRKPGPSWFPGPKHQTKPEYLEYRPGKPVRELPPGRRTVVIGGVTYYEHGGIFFRPTRSGYIVVAAPSSDVVLVRPSIGTTVLSLPIGSVSVTVGGIVYYRQGDVFYRPGTKGYLVVERPKDYVVVEAPLPTKPPETAVMVPATPAESYTEVLVNGETFHYRDSQFHRKGLTGFLAVDAPVGAVLVAPPTSAIAMWFGDDEYYYANSAFYRKTPNGYAVVLPPANAYVKALPKEAKRIWCDGRKYYAINGAFYVEKDRGLLITSPPLVLTVSQVPVGTTAAAPPDGSIQVWVDDTEFSYFSGTFYRRTPTGVVVTAVPL